MKKSKQIDMGEYWYAIEDYGYHAEKGVPWYLRSCKEASLDQFRRDLGMMIDMHFPSKAHKVHLYMEGIEAVKPDDQFYHARKQYHPYLKPNRSVKGPRKELGDWLRSIGCPSVAKFLKI